ncbi:unnamed protein product [Blepharisma stoltei]|uniref:Man1/Src1 C-terminal domain-containing protein n=1 Tax=Blepharisma stoltei TaxID=1481888 RepID=A0AAU9ISA3_9CILI|nr:unnamed protein product [Blepharisma stoltei]
MDKIRILTPQKSKVYSDGSQSAYIKRFEAFTPSPKKNQLSQTPVKIHNFKTNENTYTRLPEMHNYESIKVPLKSKEPIVLPNQNTGLLEEELQSMFKTATDEIGYFPDIKTTLLQFLTFCTAILGIFVLSSIIWDIMNEQRYCSEINESGCLPCPQHSICSGKSMHCEHSFIKIQNKCIENSKEEIKIHSIFGEIERYVSEHARLEYRASRSCFKMTLKEYFYLFPQEYFIEEKIKELLDKNESSVIEVFRENSIDFIKAKVLKFKLEDIIIIFLQDNRIFFEILVTIIILSFTFYKIHAVKEKTRRSAKKIYDLICSQLKKNCDGTSNHGILESRLKNILIESLGLKLFEKIWIVIQKTQKTDYYLISRKRTSERGEDYLWQWNDK